MEHFRQRDMAQKILGHGFQAPNASMWGYELKLLALYLRDQYGMKPSSIKAYLDVFCHDHIRDYHYRSCYRMIDAACKYAQDRKNALIQIDRIDVTEGEAGYIRALDMPYDHKKAMFTLLVIKKLDALCYEKRHAGSRYGMGYLSADEEKMRFFRQASCLPPKINIPRDILFRWREMGLIRVTHAGFILDFMERMPADGETAVSVRHFDCIGLYWDKLEHPEQTGECAVCGKPFRKIRGGRIYCPEHSGYRKGEKPPAVRKMTCEKCGEAFYVSAHAARARLCPPCSRKTDT